MTEGIIPILGAIKRTKDRKVHILPDNWPVSKYNETRMELEQNSRRLHIWIADNTSGRFYLGAQIVAFEDEKDFVLFKLWYNDGS